MSVSFEGERAGLDPHGLDDSLTCVPPISAIGLMTKQSWF
jgi:hypothetical protein